ncbi:DUF2079 domain-containing protein [Actinospica durhamensis]|uniref:DUF2079 domain-containing protein n=1 Tax=Actinospica durhamensis TaxID=1508375 RepID=A0A941EVT5_9ACTN|nr:DUF2079 domain-containing protein [Actinospica durhamensis]MBR7837292.1 DUF2079 domain-containing protein [Actinospica durhamensis]
MTRTDAPDSAPAGPPQSDATTAPPATPDTHRAPAPAHPADRIRGALRRIGAIVRIPFTGPGSALAWGAAALTFALYAALAVRDQQRMLTGGYDLGIFEETVRAYAHGHLPYVALKGLHYNELGDHFSPIWAVLAPFYLLFPSPYTLLLAQAALFAVGVVPLMRWAVRAVSRPAALVVGFGYGLSWGIASAAGFDVHEIAFAVPLLSFSATALGHRRWRAAAAWALPLLLVKEDLGLTLGAIGVYIALHGARRLGAAVAATGVLGTVLEVKVLIPAFNTNGSYGYAGKIGAFQGGILGAPRDVLNFVTPETKIVTVLLLLAVAGFIGLRSPLTLLAVPTLAWRFLSDNQSYWGTAAQYSAVLMPIVFAGFVDALARLRAAGHPESAKTARTALIASLVATAVLVPDYPLWNLVHTSTWRTSARIAAARQVMAEIPDGVTIATGDQLVPQLTDRDTVYLLIPETPAAPPEYVLFDTENPDNFPLRPGEQAQLIKTFRKDGYRTLADRDGYLLLEQ